jgi:hypothetical protein
LREVLVRVEKEGITDGAVKIGGPAPTAAATMVRRTNASRADDVSAAAMVPEGTLNPDFHEPSIHKIPELGSSAKVYFIEVCIHMTRKGYEALSDNDVVEALVLSA